MLLNTVSKKYDRKMVGYFTDYNNGLITGLGGIGDKVIDARGRIDRASGWFGDSSHF
jgi:hypothetical protein